MDELNTLQDLGFTLPSPAYIFGAIVFGVIGMAAFYYGKRTSRQTVKWLGVVLMLYPYVIPGTEALYLVGVALCGALVYFRDR